MLVELRNTVMRLEVDLSANGSEDMYNDYTVVALEAEVKDHLSMLKA